MITTTNTILNALLRTEYARLFARMERVKLRQGEVLFNSDQRIRHVYFPEDAVVAMLDMMADGQAIDVGVIGREGIVGINIFLGGSSTPRAAPA